MWAKLMIGQCFSRASRRCSSYILFLGSFDMVGLCLWDALFRWRSSWRVFTPPMCVPFFFGLGTSTHVCSWSITDHYIIERHVSYAWYGCWTINALVEAEVSWWIYSDSGGRSSSVDHCQALSVLILKNNKTEKKTILNSLSAMDGCDRPLKN